MKGEEVPALGQAMETAPVEASMAGLTADSVLARLTAAETQDSGGDGAAVELAVMLLDDRLLQLNDQDWQNVVITVFQQLHLAETPEAESAKAALLGTIAMEHTPLEEGMSVMFWDDTYNNYFDGRIGATPAADSLEIDLIDLRGDRRLKFTRQKLRRPQAGAAAILRFAAAKGEATLVEELISHGVDAVTSCEAETLDSALHLATRAGHADVVRVLLWANCWDAQRNQLRQQPKEMAQACVVVETRGALVRAFNPSLCDLDIEQQQRWDRRCILEAGDDNLTVEASACRLRAAVKKDTTESHVEVKRLISELRTLLAPQHTPANKSSSRVNYGGNRRGSSATNTDAEAPPVNKSSSKVSFGGNRRGSSATDTDAEAPPVNKSSSKVSFSVNRRGSSATTADATEMPSNKSSSKVSFNASRRPQVNSATSDTTSDAPPENNESPKQSVSRRVSTSTDIGISKPSVAKTDQEPIPVLSSTEDTESDCGVTALMIASYWNMLEHVNEISRVEEQRLVSDPLCGAIDARKGRARGGPKWAKAEEALFKAEVPRWLGAYTHRGCHALHFAAIQGNTPVVHELAKHGGSDLITATNFNNGKTALHFAAENNHVETLSALVGLGGNVKNSDFEGWTAMQRASVAGHEKCVQVLLRAGAKVDHADLRGNTALLASTAVGHEACARVLLDAGANVAHANKDGRTALLWTSYNGHASCVNLLLNAGADVSHGNSKGRTPLLWASYNGHAECVQLLLGANSDVGHSDNDGWTPLLAASANGHEICVRLLLKANADVAQHDDGYTALLWASQNGHAACVRLLLSAGASVSDENNDGRTALLTASFSGQKECIILLLHAGADVLHEDKDGSTAWMLASANEHEECIHVLRGAEDGELPHLDKPLSTPATSPAESCARKAESMAGAGDGKEGASDDSDGDIDDIVQPVPVMRQSFRGRSGSTMLKRLSDAASTLANFVGGSSTGVDTLTPTAPSGAASTQARGSPRRQRA